MDVHRKTLSILSPTCDGYTIAATELTISGTCTCTLQSTLSELNTLYHSLVGSSLHAKLQWEQSLII